MSFADWPVEVNEFGCWVWSSHLDKRTGYALIWRGKSPAKAIKIVYEQEIGPVPDGMDLDHSCRERPCVAPHHLEPVKPSENMRRKSWRYRTLIKQCKNGHDMKINAIVTPNGGRVCRTCNQEANR